MQSIPSVQPIEQKTEISTVERIAIPGLLVGVLYGAYSTALAGIRYQNEIRNSIFQLGVPRGTPKLSHNDAEMLLWSDWLTVCCANLVYCLLIGLIIYSIPAFVLQHKHLDDQMKKKICQLRWICVLLPVLGFVGSLYGGLMDFVRLRYYIASLR